MGYTSMGFVAGVLLAAKGGVSFAPLWAFLTGLSMSGTLNFAIVQPVAERLPVWQIATIVAAVNFRYAFYGFAMLAKWEGAPVLKKIFLVHTLADENFALEASCRYSSRGAHFLYCLAISAMNLSYWIAGLVSGALAVAALSGTVEPESLRRWTNGMEFAMTALFIVILCDWAKGAFRRAK